MDRSAARNIYALAVILLVSGAVFAQSFDSFTSKYFDSDVAVQKAVLDSSGVQYTLVSAGGKEVFVLDPSNSPVLDSSKIEQILKDSLIHDSNYMSLVSEVKSDMNQFESVRQQNDSYCRQLTGTTNLPCTTLDECKTACQSNPNCQSGLYNAPNSMEDVLSWYTNTTAITSDVSAFVKNADSLSQSKSAVDSETALLAKIQSETANIQGNELFKTQIGEGGYEYCPKVDYSPALLSQVGSDLQKMGTVMAQIQQVSDRAAAIVSNSNSQIAYAQQRQPLADALEKKTLGESAQLRLDFNDLNSKVSMPNLESNVATLEEYSSNVSDLVSQGKYSKAMAIEAPFDSLYASTESDLAVQKNRYSSLTASLKAVKGKIAAARQALTGSSLDQINSIDSQVSQVEGAMNTQMSSSDLSSYSSKLAGYDTQINQVVAQAALSGNAKAPASSQQEAPQQASLFGIALPAIFAGVPQPYLIAGAIVVALFVIAILVLAVSFARSLFGGKKHGKGLADASGKHGKRK